MGCNRSNQPHRINIGSLAAVLAGIIALGANADVIFVDVDAQGANNGTSWPDAFNDLQDALAPGQPGDEMWVAEGRYTPDSGTGDRVATFYLRQGIAIFGGFAGFETSREQRDPAAHETILSGDLNGDDLPNFVNNTENSFHVLSAQGVSFSAVLDGLTIKGGNANGSRSVRRHAGGGLALLGDASPAIINCVFKENAASRGGGLWTRSFSDPELTDCRFINNFATEIGGGMYIDSRSASRLLRCEFTQNTTTGDGGGMATHIQSAARLVECRFASNVAMRYGGGMYNIGSNPNILGCEFVSNTAGVNGGGLAHFARAAPLLVNTLFVSNHATGHGGGVINWASSPTLTNCTFFRNDADDSGGGIFSQTSSSVVRISNSILWQNSARNQLQFGVTSGATMVINYCCVQGGTSISGGLGNIDLNPRFVSPGVSDVHLGPGSPCIDAGCLFGLPDDRFDVDGDGDTRELFPFDLDNEPRFDDDPATPDTGCGFAPLPDMGAFEFGTGGSQPTCRGDLNNDRVVDLADLAILLAEFGTGQRPGGDINCDLETNLVDLGILLANFSHACP